MEASNRQAWLNFLSLLPGTTLTLLTIAVAFLRFYDEQDFRILELIGQPRVWSNRLTVAAALVALVNFCVEWDRRNRETSRAARAEAQAANDRAAEAQRRAEEEQRRAEEEQRRAEERERAARRARVEVERDLALLSFLTDPSDENRRKLTQTIAVLDQYRDSL
jgi:signal transduction histidine kinase